LIKKVISGGCSFTQFHNGWSKFLAKHIDADLINTAVISSGNSLISRRVIHSVETQERDDLLVAVQWSSAGRSARFFTDAQIELWELENKQHTMLSQDCGNPCRMFDSGGWLLSSATWPDNVSKDYYKHSNSIDENIKTYEDILRTQDYLKLHKINYVMFLGWDKCLDKELYENPNIKYLRNMIDYSKWIEPEFEWCLETGEPFMEEIVLGKESHRRSGHWTHHPTPIQHRMYTEGVIIPHLKSRGLI
jgi:WD40 repeat protein|tara:strand:- start:11 stop:754 length:744 start_codon:yes stop_codon:yes gene_type:complete